MQQFGLISILLLCLCGSAQDYKWAYNFGGEVSDIGTHVTVDKEYNPIFVGKFYRKVDFNPGTEKRILRGSGHYYITKFSQSGEFLWAKKWGKHTGKWISRIKTDSEGNILLTGNFYGMNKFSTGNKKIELRASFRNDTYFAKLDNQGNLLWANQIGQYQINEKNLDSSYDKEASESILDMSFDPSGNIYLTGYFQHTIDFDPSEEEEYLISTLCVRNSYKKYKKTTGEWNAYIAKYTPEGKIIWAKRVTEGWRDYGIAIHANDDGTFYTYGVTIPYVASVGKERAMKEGANLDAKRHMYLRKYTGDGELIWEKRIEAPDSHRIYHFGQQGYEMQVMGDHIYISGSRYGTMDFDPKREDDNINSERFVSFVAKYDLKGNFIWNRQIDGSGDVMLRALKVHPSGDVYLAGVFKESIDLDPSEGVRLFEMPDSSKMMGSFLVKLDNEGKYVLGKKMDGTLNYSRDVLAPDDCNNVYFTGSMYTKEVELKDEGKEDGILLKSHSRYGGTTYQPDALIMKMTYNPVLDSNLKILGDNKLCIGSKNQFNVGEIPGAETFEWSIPSNCAKIYSSKDTIELKPLDYFENETIELVVRDYCGGELLRLSKTISTHLPIDVPEIKYNLGILICENCDHSAEWKAVSGEIESSTGVSTKVLEPGYFYGINIDRNGCKSYPADLINVEDSTSTDKLSLSVFPNPVTEIGNWRLEDNGIKVDNASIEIIAINGQLIMELTDIQNSFEGQFNVKKWQPGIYLIRWKSGEQSVMQKFTVLP